MSTRAVQKKNNGSATPKSKHKHPLRIVPTHPFARDASAPAPHLTYRNGPLLTSVEVFTVFWGKAWQEPPNDILPGEVNSFFDFILTSSSSTNSPIQRPRQIHFWVENICHPEPACGRQATRFSLCEDLKRCASPLCRPHLDASLILREWKCKLLLPDPHSAVRRISTRSWVGAS